MASPSYEAEILAEVEHLKMEEQRQVLEFARSLRKRAIRGTPEGRFLEVLATIKIDTEDLKRMAKAIEEDCEQVERGAAPRGCSIRDQLPTAARDRSADVAVEWRAGPNDR